MTFATCIAQDLPVTTPTRAWPSRALICFFTPSSTIFFLFNNVSSGFNTGFGSTSNSFALPFLFCFIADIKAFFHGTRNDLADLSVCRRNVLQATCNYHRQCIVRCAGCRPSPVVHFNFFRGQTAPKVSVAFPNDRSASHAPPAISYLSLGQAFSARPASAASDGVLSLKTFRCRPSVSLP